LVDLGWILNEFISMLALIITNFKAFRIYFAIRLADCQHRIDSKHQEYTIPQIKNADTKTMIDNCNLQNAISCNKRRSLKTGGGGNRAAWRIQIKQTTFFQHDV